LNSLRLMYREGGLEIPADELGLGIQSALVVGIFDALRRLGGQVGTLIIEEPEMYLHPQAQRYFYRLLAQMADEGECQVIYSTHSPIFADITRFSSIRLMRKESGGMTTVSRIANSEDETYLASQHSSQKLAPAFDAARSEMLFARRALLVEGHGDRVAVLDVAARLGFDPDAEDLAVVMCGSKSTIPFFARVCKALGVPCFILHDEDVYPTNETTEENGYVERENRRSEAVNAEIRKAAGEDSRIFAIQPSLEGALGISRKAKDKPKRIVGALQKLSLDELPVVLRSAVEALFAEA
jgi:putative ATP-dependent endonuclease of the OLD family